MAQSSKKFYPKDSVFNKSKTQVKNNKEIVTKVTEHTVVFGSTSILFKQGEAVTKDQLSVMSKYQKEFYLIEK